MGSIIPGVFNAAGLIVPEPSMISPPIPFIEVETGWVAWYMTTNCYICFRLQAGRQRAGARAVAPTVLVRESARSRLLDDGRLFVWLDRRFAATTTTTLT